MKVVFEGRLDIYSGDTVLRSCGTEGSLQDLEANAYFTFALLVSNRERRPFSWKEACVKVDGGDAWHWSAGQIPPGNTWYFPIAYCNMKTCMSPGAHTAVWYFDGQERHRQRFLLTEQRGFPLPTAQQIRAYRNPDKRRSPYLCGWLHAPVGTRYTQYTIEFQATHLPKGTYCCLGNWAMDLSELEPYYASVRAEGWCHGYAGFQKLADGQSASIMSFWDLHCKTQGGRETTLRAKRLHPREVLGGSSFSGEGTGARSIVPYAWEANHWYRMHLKCIQKKYTTLVEQWVQDLETGSSTLLCCFDTGVFRSCFRGDMAIFLENYLWEIAGQVRGMEVRNPRYLNADTGKWESFRQITLASQGGVPQYEGSYDFGVTDGCVWMLTSGVGGDWFHNGKGKKSTRFSLVK